MSMVNTENEQKLGSYLLANLSNFSTPYNITKFNSGQSNPTYLIKSGDYSYVLRAKPPGKLLKSAHQVDREYRLMKALADSNVPVPKVHLLCQDESIFGQEFFVMEFLDGKIYWDPALTSSELEIENDTLSIPYRIEIYDAMNAALAKLHLINPSNVGLKDFGVPGNYFQRQLSRWSKQYISSEIEVNNDIHALIDWLTQNMPDDDGRVCIVHGDYRLDNMVFAKDKAEILGILDWELSTLGHPFADLAYQCMQWRLPNSGSFRGLGGIDRNAIGIPTEEEYVAAYCERTAIDKIDNWSFYIVFSFFRIAAILQGVYKRSLDGNASNPEKAKEYGRAVPLLGKMARELI